MVNTVVSLAFSLFLLMDAIGNLPIFISILREIPPKRQKIIIIRELLIALAILIIFHFIGEALLNLLRVKQSTVMIAGGIILFLIALKMIFPSRPVIKNGDTNLEEPFIVPLAVPLIAGPGVLAAIMLYSHQEPHWVVISAIIIAWIASTIILYCSSFLKRILGERGMLAAERLMGLIVTLIAVQMFLEGIREFIATA